MIHLWLDTSIVLEEDKCLFIGESQSLLKLIWYLENVFVHRCGCSFSILSLLDFPLEMVIKQKKKNSMTRYRCGQAEKSRRWNVGWRKWNIEKKLLKMFQQLVSTPLMRQCARICWRNEILFFFCLFKVKEKIIFSYWIRFNLILHFLLIKNISHQHWSTGLHANRQKRWHKDDLSFSFIHNFQKKKKRE